MKSRGRFVGRRLVAAISSFGVISAGFVSTVTFGTKPASAATAPPGVAGALDSSWGSGGIATVPVPGSSALLPSNRTIVLADGSVIVAGVQPAQPGSLVVAKLTPSGSLDSSFGIRGLAMPGLGGAPIDSVTLGLQPATGDIIVGGSKVIGGSSELALARMTPSGALDTTFGSSGIEVLGSDGGYALRGTLSLAVSASGSIDVVPRRGDTGDNAVLLQFTANGLLDSTFGSKGLAALDTHDSHTVPDDLAYTSDGNIVLVGSSVVKKATMTLIARFTSSGQPDASFPSANSQGFETVDASGTGAFNTATAVTVDQAGHIVLTGIIINTNLLSSAYVLRLSSAGARDTSFGANGVVTGTFDGVIGAGTAIAVDAAGRYLVAGATAPSGMVPNALGVERLTSGSDPYDPYFGVGSSPGRESIACPSSSLAGTASAVAVAPSQRTVVAGTCNGSLEIARLNGGNISNLMMTTSTPQAPAGHGTVPLSSIPASALLATSPSLIGAPGFGTPGFGTPGFGTPGFGTPGFGTPGFGTPGFGTPGFGTPLLQSALTDPALGAIPLSDLPIVATAGGSAPTWDSILAGTPLAGSPTQSVTLGQVLALNPLPTGIQSLTLGQMDVSSTSLRKATLGAYLLGRTPISSLPTPTGGWCTFLASQAYNCSSNPAAGTSQSLLDLELGGDTLQGYYSTAVINLVGLNLVDSPLTYLPINDIDMSLTTLGTTATTALKTPANFVLCTPSATSGSCDNLVDAQKSGNLQPVVGATLESLLMDSPGAVGQLSLANLIGGLVPSQNLPIENIPLSAIVASSPLPATGAAYEVTFNLGCSVASSLVITPSLPTGFRVIPSTASMTVGAASPAVTVAGNGSIQTSSPLTCSGTQPVVVKFQAEPGTVLGPTTAGVTVSTSSDVMSLSNQAGVTVTKNFITTGATNPANPANVGTYDTLYLGHIASPGDLDYFSLQPPPAGSQLIVTLSHLPNDDDLVVYGAAQPELRATPGFGTPGFGTPGFGTPGFGTPGFGTPGFGTPGFGTPGFGTAVSNPTSTFDDQASTSPSNLDADVPRLNLPIRAFSDQRGTTDESVTIRVTATDTSPFLIQVSGYNGSWSNQPYVLRVSVVPPPQAAATCPAQTFQYSGTAGQLPSTPLASSTQTLILVNERRLGARYGNVNLPDGTSGDAGQVVVSHLESLAQQPTVKGVVVPIDGDPTVSAAYAAWDASPCNVALADAVVADINALVDRLRVGLPNLTNIVLVGDDVIVPFGRVEDYTSAFNESQFTEDAFGGIENAESSAALNGYLLSDNPYGDLAPTPYFDSQLYVPQLAVGRLVETPSDIVSQINSFIAAGGVTTPASSFVTGYAPFDKGALQVSQTLSNDVGAATSSSQINETWTRADAIAGVDSAASGYVSVNAHYDIYRALPGNGDASNPYSTADLPASLAGGVEFTIGCHSGLSIPDVYIANPSQAQQAELLDWPQAEMHNGAAGYAGNTGYGLGDTDTIAYSERMELLFAENLGPSMTLGQAMSFAKQSYVSSVGVPSVYDAKAIEENTFYGLPMWRIGPNGKQAPVVLPSSSNSNPPAFATTTQDTQINNFVLASSTTGRGSYYTVGNQPPQVTPQQPIEPLTVVPLPSRTDGLVAHGAIIEQLTSSDVVPFTSDFDTPVADSASFNPEPPVTSSFFPSELQSVSGTVTATGRQDSLDLVAGQFFSSANGNGSGMQRLYSDIKTTAMYSNSDNYTPPSIAGVVATIQGSVVQFVVTSPSSNVTRGVVLMLVSGGTTSQNWQHVELENVGGGQWIGTATVPSGTTTVGQYFAQLADSNGNVAVSSNKGQDFSAGVAPAGSFTLAVSPPPDPGTGLYSSPTSVTLTPPAGTTATYSLDGGPVTPLNGPITISGDGTHTLTATASNGTTSTYTFPIDTNPPNVTITTPSQGASYSRGSTVKSSVSCTSDVTLASCMYPATVDTSSPGAHTFTAVATDVFGRTTTVTNSYSVTYQVPSVTFTSTPQVRTAQTTAGFAYTLADPDQLPSTLSVSCTLNGTAVPCTQSGATLNGLTAGTTYTFAVTVTDQWGGSGSATYTWYVDQPPTVTITSGPTNGTDQTTTSFSYGVSDPDDPASALTVSCTLNNSPVTCGASSASLNGLVPGTTYTFVVTVNDPWGGTASATWTWTINYDTSVTVGAVGETNEVTADLTYTASGSTTGLASQTVTWYAGSSASGSPVCSAVTDANGEAVCYLTATGLNAVNTAQDLTAVFSGTPPYLGSSNTIPIYYDNDADLDTNPGG